VQWVPLSVLHGFAQDFSRDARSNAAIHGKDKQIAKYFSCQARRTEAGASAAYSKYVNERLRGATQHDAEKASKRVRRILGERQGAPKQERVQRTPST
jgi:hypothetical protein